MLFFLIRVTLVLGIAVGGGAFSAMYAIDNDIGLGTVRFDPWTAHPGRGGVDDDPYSRARLARSGEIPLGQAEGIEFIAITDSGGAELLHDCRYRVTGRVPASRYWTLYAAPAELLRPEETAAARPASLNSRHLMRKADNTFEIAVSRSAQPGNWLPLSGSGVMRLVLTLYGAPVSTNSSLSDIALPNIIREACRG